MQGFHYITAMVCGVAALVTGVVILMSLTDSAIWPFGWVLIVIGLITLGGNYLIRRQTR